MSSQRKILAAIAVVVILAAIAAILSSRSSRVMEAETPLIETQAVSPTTLPPANPAEAVSNTTFDIISPSTQPATSTISESMPGSSGY